MSNVFNFKRFLTYFKWDFHSACCNYGLSMLLCGSLPLIIFALSQLFSLVVSGHWFESSNNAIWSIAFVTAILVVTLTLPVKCYGRITEKRYGSEWLMIPASTLEKTLSVFIMMCIVAPLALFVLLLFWNVLLSSVFPLYFGKSLFVTLNPAFVNSPVSPAFLVTCIVLGWFNNILTFTLGAVCFRKSKVVRTVLVSTAVTFVVSYLMLALIGHTFDISGINFSIGPDDPPYVIRSFVRGCCIVSSLVSLALLSAIYFRLRTIKQ